MVAGRFFVMSLVATVILASCSLVPRGVSSAAPVAATASPDASVTPPASPTPIPIAGHLGEALPYVPPVTSSIAFTDWAALKAGVGASKLTGASSFSAKADALRNEATPAGYGLRFIGAHRYDWGFDVMDLEWDLLIIAVSGAPVWVLRFTDGFDLGPFKRHLEERGFAAESSPAGQLYTHALDPDAEWAASTELAILDTAFLKDGRTVILSPDDAPVREMLAHGPIDGMDATARRVANLLGTPAAATMLLGHDTCGDLAAGLPTSPAELRASIDKELKAAGPLHAYDALAISYSRDDEVIGRIVIGYEDGARATADVAGRTELARSGTSTRTQRSYADSLFTIARTRQEPGSIVLEVSPRDDSPVRLFGMVDDRDMLFALCTAAT